MKENAKEKELTTEITEPTEKEIIAAKGMASSETKLAEVDLIKALD